MALKLMYITNQPVVALMAESTGVDRIFVDMEYIGKALRQGGMDTVQSHHTFEDIIAVRQMIHKADLLVRVNPIHEKTADYISSREEINKVIECGADIVMLPYFKTVGEVSTFLDIVNGRVRTMLLLETPEAAEKIQEILQLPGIDEMFIGLNDLSLGYGQRFMFEPLADGTVEELCLQFRRMGIPYGFGGIAYPGKGMLPSEYIIREHYRLGSGCVILSRSFCNTSVMTDMNEILRTFTEGVDRIRALERECEVHSRYFEDNRRELVRRVGVICESVRQT